MSSGIDADSASGSAKWPCTAPFEESYPLNGVPVAPASFTRKRWPSPQAQLLALNRGGTDSPGDVKMVAVSRDELVN
jgi:hypothetical protein